jgi:diguanylate cyclase (GGDEF)-like protein
MLMSQPQGTLLVVDDDAMNRDALSRRLTRTGYTVLTAENGADALTMIGQNRIDAVLLDIMMPGMSGIETLRSLRQSRSVSDLPVIMVTAKDGSDDVVEALGLGANDYVTKPIDYAVALARIRAQVTARRSDPLTGLPNRLLFLERINRLLKGGGGHSEHAAGFAVLFIDVDRFKVINDSLGHAAGDELLSTLAVRLQHALRSTDSISRYEEPTLARIGGDEFTILVNGIDEADAATAVAERLRAVAAQPFQVHGREIVTSLSIGIVLSADRYTRAEDMIRDADTAMYRAKRNGKGRCEIFDTSMLEAAQERLRLETDLRHALERQEFELHYQPIVSLAAGRVAGFEALIRWRHPERGLIPPADFISIAEDSGLIVPMGIWVLREACTQLQAWERDCGVQGIVINVNLSARQCMHPDLLKDVARILAETKCPAEQVKLEITEGVVLENSDNVSKVLHDLRALGVQLGLDDFGMGYSALSYLQRFPFQTIKIDRTFVSGMKETGNTEIIRAIVSMASGLDMNVTAEGIETADQVRRLQDLACEFGQGYYFHRPLSARDAGAMLSAPRASAQSV